MTFQQKLDKIVKKNNSLLCIGLDPDPEKLPPHILKNKEPFFSFNKAIIDNTFDLVCAYKPNSAFYEAEGSKGILELKNTCDYLRKNHPEIVIILDAKRGDIGNTNNAYAKYAFDYLGVDAITMQPYLGGKPLDPFLEREDKGIIILCRTSNEGAGEFQDLLVEGKPLYLIVAKNVSESWNSKKNCLLVAGATYPQELANIRKIAPNMTFLVPGIGSQGGEVEETLKAGLDKDGKGLIVNASRAILYASKEKDFAAKSRLKAVETRDLINHYSEAKLRKKNHGR